MMILFDDEQIRKAHDMSIMRETAERMIKKGKMTIEEIAEYVPELTLEELKKMKEEIMQLV